MVPIVPGRSISRAASRALEAPSREVLMSGARWSTGGCSVIAADPGSCERPGLAELGRVADRTDRIHRACRRTGSLLPPEPTAPAKLLPPLEDRLDLPDV